MTAEADMDDYVLKRRTIVVRHASGDRIVALVEIVSPGNNAGGEECAAGWPLLTIPTNSQLSSRGGSSNGSTSKSRVRRLLYNRICLLISGSPLFFSRAIAQQLCERPQVEHFLARSRPRT